MAKNDPGYNPDLHERMWNTVHRSIYTSNTNGLVGISRQDVVKLLSCWDTMFYPSGGEGFGNPPFECMAAGTPVVYSDYSAHAEFCAFGGLPVRVTYQPELHHGIMRASVDTNHAVEQMLQVRHNSELRKQLGVSGRVHARKFSTAHMVSSWDKLFQELMTKSLPIDSDHLFAQAL